VERPLRVGEMVGDPVVVVLQPGSLTHEISDCRLQIADSDCRFHIAQSEI
jgi:hypothetical protein